ncbi:integrase, catalytic region, zinc finger, CCHC-type containing protein [Tanacetum coccineum]
MQGTELSYQERECKLYNEFDKFTSIKGESLHEYYLRFSQLINDMQTIGMTMQQVQVNTKFLNALQPEWSKFVTEVKLAKNMYTTNFYQLYAYLSQHEAHVNEVRMMRARYPDPLALVANHQTQSNFVHTSSSTIISTFLSSLNQSSNTICDDPIACLNKDMEFMSTVVASRFLSTNNQLRTSSNPRNQATIQDDREAGQELDEEQLAFLADPRIPDGQAIQTTIPHNASFQTDDLDAYDYDCDDLFYKIGSHGKSFNVQETQNFEQSLIDYVPDKEITSDSNINSYEQYLQQTQNTIVQDTNSSTQQDAMILSVIKQMSNHVTNCNKTNLENKRINESLTAELERYKERLKTFIQRFNVDLNSHEKIIDSQMDDMIQDRNALKQEIDSLKQTLSKHVNEKESTSFLVINFKPYSEQLVVPQIPIKIEAPKEVTKLHIEREHLKKTYKKLYDSIKKTRVQTKDQCNSLIAQLNQKSVENADLNAQIQEKVFVATTLKNELRKLKGNNVLENATPMPNPKVIAPGMFKLDLEPLAPKVLKNRDTHIDYIKHSWEHAGILREIVKNVRAQSLLDSNLDSARMKSSTSASRSQFSDNTKNNRISQTTSRNLKNKVEDHHRSVKNKKNYVIEPMCNANVKHTMLNANSELICVKCTVRFINDQIVKIIGYRDYQMGKVTISQVYYVEGLGHNLFFFGQFCDSDLEFAFRKHTCYIRDLEGVDLLKRSRGSNLYTLSLEDMLLSSPICLFLKASKTKSWLWHRRLSHLNFEYITTLAKQGLVRGLPKLKFEGLLMFRLCSIQKQETLPQTQSKELTQEKLYLLHMDLCGQCGFKVSMVGIQTGLLLTITLGLLG